MFSILAGPRVALGVLGLAVLAFAVYPWSSTANMVIYYSIAVIALALAWYGLFRNRPTRYRGWVLVIGGFSGWVLGDFVYLVEDALWEGAYYPVPSDAFYLGAYGLFAAGALLMVRTRRAGRDMTALLDATIIAAGAAVVAAVFVIAPLAADSDLTAFGKVVASAYPVGDLLLIAVIVRMWASPNARTAAYRLLVAALGLTLVADVVWQAGIIAFDLPVNKWSDVMWLTSYIAIGAAASATSMRTLAEPPPDREATASSQRRLAVLACGIMLPAVALIVDGATGGDVLWPVIGLGALLISWLVLLRMGGILRTVEVQAVQLAALARSDALTGAPNRRTWDHELSRACAISREEDTQLCVAMMDMDHFKPYNDAYGHQAGDRLLREAVASWSEQLGADALLARYGGEEFAVLLPGVSLSEAQERIAALASVTPDGQTFSAGVSLWDPRTEPAKAVAWADLALYEAKRSGRDRVLVYGRLTPAADGVTLPGFTLVMQPIIDIVTGSVVGHEALTRFDTLGHDIQAVFRQAHADGHGDLLEAATISAAITVAGRPPGQALYVNASVEALTSARFWDQLPARLDGLTVELTEELTAVDPGMLLDAVHRLRSRGASLALDDLGAGFGELYRLAALRPDMVKADRSLVQGCSIDPGQSAVLQALVTYAAQLGVVVCAEGVEDPADLDHIRRLGITRAQGFLLGRPGPPWQVGPFSAQELGADREFGATVAGRS